MSTHAFDVGIIGGGLAGLCLSIQLQKEGIQTVVFEKESYPFHRVCGEYISMESYGFLQSIGLNLDSMKLPRITQLNVSSPSGSILSHKLAMGGFGISRYQLDGKLATLARSVGVTLLESTKVTKVIADEITTIITTGKKYNVKLACGSWGKRSNMDVQLQRGFVSLQHRGLNNYIGVKYHVKADLPWDTIELHNFRNGYCGISKIEDDRYCLCYLVKAEELKRANGNIQLMQENVLMKNPFLKKYFTEFPSLYDKPLTISQVSFSDKTLAENNIIMLGDSAGLIAPLCGNGMSMAMHASKILAAEILANRNDFSPGKISSAYRVKWKKAFKKRLFFGRMIQRMFGNETATNLLVLFLKRLPVVVNYLIGKTHGKAF